MLYYCLLDVKEKKEFETKEQRDEYFKILEAYIDGREKCTKNKIESLIEKLENDILQIENNYYDDIAKEIEQVYGNYMKA